MNTHIGKIMTSDIVALSPKYSFKNLLNFSFISLLLLGALAFHNPAKAQPSALPNAFQANYAVARGGMHLGNLNVTLRYSGNRYSYHKYTKTTGMAKLLTGLKITETTDGVLHGVNVVPQSYLFNQSRRKKQRIDKASLKGGRAIGSYKNNPYNIAIRPGTQDRASLELVLARDIAQNKPRLSYQVVERGKIKQYNFQKMGNQQIQTPTGTYNTVKVKVVRDGNKRQTVFWMAKELNYLPVKISHTEKGDVLTSVIRSYNKL